MKPLKTLVITLFLIISIVPCVALAAAKCTANGVPYDTCVCFPSGECVDIGDPGVFP